MAVSNAVIKVKEFRELGFYFYFHVTQSNVQEELWLKCVRILEALSESQSVMWNGNRRLKRSKMFFPFLSLLMHSCIRCQLQHSQFRYAWGQNYPQVVMHIFCDGDSDRTCEIYKWMYGCMSRYLILSFILSTTHPIVEKLSTGLELWCMTFFSPGLVALVRLSYWRLMDQLNWSKQWQIQISPQWFDD